MFAVGSHSVMGQSQISQAVRNAQPMSASDQSKVADYVQTQLVDLSSSDTSRAQAARDRLLTPVLGPTSVSFRLYYSQQALPTLEAMLQGTRVVELHRAQLILTVAGAIASEASLTLILKGMEDDRAAVRFGAAREIGVLLGQVDSGQATVQQDRLPQLISQLRQTLATDPDLFVASEIAKALVTPEQTQSLLDMGLEAMCLGMADRLEAGIGDANPSEKVTATLRAIKDARDRLIDRQIQGAESEKLNQAADRFAQAATSFARAIASDPALTADSVTLNNRLLIVADNVHQLAVGF